MSSATQARFHLANAFTTRFSGGNPAAVVQVDNELPVASMCEIAAIFNQPVTTFVIAKPPIDEETQAGIASYDIRWIIGGKEMPLCGHGTIAAAKTLFLASLPSIHTLRFHSKFSGVVTAKRSENTRITVDLPAGVLESTSEAYAKKVIEVMAKSLGRAYEDLNPNVVEVKVQAAGRHFVVIIVAEEEGIESWKVNDKELLALAPQHTMITVSSKCTRPDTSVAFETRTFGPYNDLPEDHVCGSAHTLVVPYWEAQLNSSLQLGSEATAQGANCPTRHARQVSPRGGDLWTTYDPQMGRVSLAGEVKVTAEGTIDISKLL